MLGRMFWCKTRQKKGDQDGFLEYCAVMEGRLQEKRRGVCLRVVSHIEAAKRSPTS